MTVAGLVTSRTDLDVFAVTRSCSGPLSATLTPAALGPDLDTRLRLLDASGAQLAASAPATARGGTWSPVLTGMGAAVAQSVGPGYLLPRGRRHRPGRPDSRLQRLRLGRPLRTLRHRLPGAAHTATAPSAPVVVAVERDGAAHGLRLVWDAPASDGGAPVTSYVVTAGGQTVTVSATTHSHTFGGLAPNTHLHTCGVVAVNGAGSGPAASRAATTGSFSGTPVAVEPDLRPHVRPHVRPDVRPDGRPTSGTPTGSPTVDPPDHAHRHHLDKPGGQRRRPRAPTTSYAVPAAPLGGSVKRGRTRATR